MQIDKQKTPSGCWLGCQVNVVLTYNSTERCFGQRQYSEVSEPQSQYFRCLDVLHSGCALSQFIAALNVSLGGSICFVRVWKWLLLSPSENKLAEASTAKCIVQRTKARKLQSNEFWLTEGVTSTKAWRNWIIRMFWNCSTWRTKIHSGCDYFHEFHFEFQFISSNWNLKTQVLDLRVVCWYTYRCRVRKVQRLCASWTAMPAPDGRWGWTHSFQQFGPRKHQTGQRSDLRKRRMGSTQNGRLCLFE